MTDPLKRLSDHDLKLTADEHEHIRSNLLSFMNEHPEDDGLPDSLRMEERKELRDSLVDHIRRHEDVVESTWFDRLFGYVSFAMPRFAAIFAGVIFLGAGASYASGSALPGDYLYPVKVFVQERIPDAFARTEIERTEKKSDRSIERLREVEGLIIRGEESDSVWEDVRTTTRQHLQETARGIENLSNSGRKEEAHQMTEQLERALVERKESFKQAKEDREHGWARAVEEDLDEALEAIRVIKQSIINEETGLPIVVPSRPSRSVIKGIERSSSSVSSASSVSSEASASSASSASSTSSAQSSSLSVSSVASSVSSDGVVEEIIEEVDDVTDEMIEEVDDTIDDVLSL